MASETDALKDAGLKITSPRLIILAVLKSEENLHLSADDVYQILIEKKHKIGLATVYRVLNQFEDAGILARHHFVDGKAVFELASQKHHDHMVCLTCGEVFEFRDEIIEAQQKLIAEKYGIELTHHSLYLYGKPIDGKCAHKKNR